MPPDVINLARGRGGESTHIFLLHSNVRQKEGCVVLFFFFLIIVYDTLCQTKHEQNFHLPFTIITVIGVLGAGGLSRGGQSSPLTSTAAGRKPPS